MNAIENFRLKVFRAVAQTLNFRKASETLFLSQPAVTQQIRALEEDLGTSLFERTRGHVTLSPSGAVLLLCAERLATLAAEAAQAVAVGLGKVWRVLSDGGEGGGCGGRK